VLVPPPGPESEVARAAAATVSAAEIPVAAEPVGVAEGDGA